MVSLWRQIQVTQQLANFKANIDAKVVTSVVVALAIFGGITYAAVRSGIKPLQAAAKAVKGA
jgi:hypothetical protein